MKDSQDNKVKTPDPGLGALILDFFVWFGLWGMTALALNHFNLTDKKMFLAYLLIFLLGFTVSKKLHL